MSIILSIDTSTRNCSVAIHRNGNLLTISELFHEKSSSGMLTTMIQDAVKYAQISFDEIDAFAVAKGPGSYTGLRIGVSTAKGLCYTLEKPLIAINTLEAMAQQIFDFQFSIFDSKHDINKSIQNLICPMIDARRMEVYCAVYQAVTYDCILETHAKIIDENSFQDLLAENKMLFLGDGAEKCKEFLGNNPNAIFIDKLINPSASTIGELATKAFEAAAFENLEEFEPFYLKDFMATTPKKQLF